MGLLLTRHFSSTFDLDNMLHVGEAFDHIAHALGYTDAAAMDEKITPARVVNDSGRFLYSVRAWQFARRMTGLASIVANQNTLDLPLGCAEIIALDRVSTTAFSGYPWRIDLVTQEEIARLQSVFLTTPNLDPALVYFAAPSFERADFDSSGLALTVTIWPTPTVSAADGVMVTFRAHWEELPSELEDINDWTLPLPAFAEQLYLSILRETAKGYENDGGGTVEQRLAAVRAWPSFDTCVQADNRVVSASGPMRGGAIHTARRAGLRNYPVLYNPDVNPQP